MRIPASPGPAGRPAEPTESPITEIGQVPWTRQDAVAALPEFLPLFDRRPIRDNQGGMRSVGLFNVWFLLRRLRPASVIESGVWKGQSTWLIEETLPGVKLLCLDPNLGLRQHVSPAARYSDADFLKLDLAGWVGGGEGCLAFFDDHQDAGPRLRRCRELGIRDIIFDDNYPDFSGNRHVSAAAVLNDRQGGQPRFPGERDYLLRNAEAYWISPPIFDHAEPVTGEKSIITVPSLLGAFDPARHGALAPYRADMPEYRWTTYIRLLPPPAPR